MFQDQIRYLDSLSEYKRGILLSYTEDIYEMFNETLRTGRPSFTRQEQKLYDVITSVFDNIPPLKSPLILYRGVKVTRDKLSIQSNSFVSASLDKEIAKSFAGKKCCLLRITVTAGSKIIPLFHLFNQEDEILLDYRGSFMKTHE